MSKQSFKRNIVSMLIKTLLKKITSLHLLLIKQDRVLGNCEKQNIHWDGHYVARRK